LSRTALTATAAPRLDRRSFLMGTLGVAGAMALSGCVSLRSRGEWDDIYGPITTDRFQIPAVDTGMIDEALLRRTVRYNTTEPVGTIVVDTPNFFVYHVQPEGMAVRYGASMPWAEFLWSGIATIDRKTEWPIWTPTAGQLSRNPEYRQWANGWPPGIDNPLGSRALYLYQNGQYTLCTIYGTSNPTIIGRGASSGCVGLLNQDIIHLYNATPIGTRVVILPV
jgi:lipoprotein-anchoring transpeptidase ErfK/SrfK